ncbi:MAG TPA: BamA/TamA family outer membrane protein [Elusimicrobiota bacterium]|jgi:hypothetical protein|nr:BamA/TamA family outer membrane protein [Elusimicrobiota bacterium]
MIKRALLGVLLLLGAAAAARALTADQDSGSGDGDQEMVPNRNTPGGVRKAAQEAVNQEDQTPAALRWMLKPIKRGMFVRLPVIDTDPNRGITYGIMPILVLQGKHDDRIEQIYAPSLNYNKDFGLSPTFRYYYYPEEDAAFIGRASKARYEHEVMTEYEDHSFLGSPYDVMVRFQKNRDAGQRFYGIGPNSSQYADANYIQDYWQYNWGVGVPLSAGSPVRAHLSQRYIASRILNGPLKGLPEFDAAFPEEFSNHSQQTNETRVNLDYDTRDHAVTTGRGTYDNVFAEASVRGYLSEYDYERYGADSRWFVPVPDHPAHVIALQGRYEQVVGPTPPFWLLSSMGGKYSLRAYGDGRYVDRGTATLNVEDRIKLYEAKTAGVTTEIQVAPFVGLGEVFDNPEVASARYARPVFGSAIRAVARPQVVGSVDVGVGREGVAVFTDINYSF